VRHPKLAAAGTCALVAALVVGFKVCADRVDPPAISVTPPPAAPASIAGTWEMKIQKRKGGTQSWTLTLEQDGKALAGVIHSEGGDLPVTGTIDGRSIFLSAKRSGVTVEFPATLYDETMVGTMHAITVTRRWTAKRQK
jgi:hypothetical protein